MKNTKNNKPLKAAVLLAHLFFATIFMLQAQEPLPSAGTNPVGAIPGEIDVSPMGAATYTIPIEVVPGTQGVQPNLSIVFNSMSGMGLLGMKWNLTGLSAITRCGEIPYFDGKITSVQFNADDRFALDGNRLILVNDVPLYGMDGAEYATEMENFARIVQYGRTLGPPDYFIAYTDDGTMIEYGNTSDSKHRLQNGDDVVIIAWLINKVTDANGNYMTFEYFEYDNTRLIKSISYTGNKHPNLKMDTYAKVEFEYKGLQTFWGTNTYFISGYEIFQGSLLDKITVSYKDTLVRKYSFFYNVNFWENGTAHLENIMLSGVDGTKYFNSTLIEWGDKNTSIEEKRIGVRCGQSITGDFNGDGHSDIIVYGENSYSGEQGWELALYNPATTLFDESISERFVTCVIMCAQDVNGDGKDELIMGSMNSTKDTLLLRILSLPSKTQIGSTLKYRVYSDSYYNELGYIGFGDFDGDGVTDILLYESDGRRGTIVGGGTTELLPPYFLRLKKIVGNNHVDMLSISPFPGMTPNVQNINSEAKIDIIDCSGTGKKRIQVEVNGTTTIYEFNGYYLDTKNTNPAYHSYAHKYYGDVNGDGITDVLVYCNENNEFKWKIFIAKGDGTFLQGSCQDYPECNLSNALDTTAANPSEGNASAPKYEPRFADINGNGKEDIIQKVGNSFIILYSKDFWGVEANYFIKETISFDDPYNNYTNWYLGDINGVGKLQILVTRPLKDPSYSPQKMITINQNNDYEFVTKITDGMGKKIELSYKHQYIFAESPSWNGYPKRINKIFLPVIDVVKTSKGIGTGFNTFQYRYYNAVFSLARRTFLGFEEFVSINNQENKKIISTFAVENWKQTVKPMSQTTYYDGISHYKTIFNYVLQDLSHSRYILYYNTITEQNFITDTKTMITNNLDNEGRLYKSYSRHFDGCNESNWLHQETNTYSYETITLNGKQKKTVPTQIITQQQFENNNIVLTDTTTYGYYTDNTNKGRLKWERKGNPDGSITTSYSNYLPSGLCQLKTVSAQGCSARLETYTYDATQRFTTSVTNAHFHEMKFEYNLKTGNKTKEIDPNGLITEYKYDAFGNLTKVIYPDLTETNTTVEWYSNSSLPNAKYSITTKTDAKPDLTVYYDVLGREVCRKADGYYYETQYNDKGQVAQTSYPFGVFGEKKIWHKYTYDNYGRKTTEIAPYDSISYSYDKRKVTITDHLRSNNTSSKNYDALGRIVEATDEGGTITYNYDVITESRKTRHQTKISVPGSGTTTIVSDLWGNRLSILEPNATKVSSTYNGFNELVTQTDGNANVTTFKYDMLGRITQKTFTDRYNKSQTIKYVYDCARNGKGKISEIKLDDKFSETFKYDYLSRISESQKLIDNMAHKLNYSYNDKSQLSQLIYDDSFAVKYSYSSAGKLYEIRRSDNSALIYKVNSRNKYNLPTYCTYGNGVATQCEYNPYGLITRIQTGKENSSSYGGGGGPLPKGGIEGQVTWVDSTILNYRYAYNTKGLMVSRSESVVNRLEEYEYDDLERLTKITAGSIGQTGTPQILSYKTNGNIDNNSTVGQYVYGSKPHAVSKITPINNNVISINQCDVAYNFFNQPTQITEEDASTPGGYHKIELFYGVNQQRNKMIQKKGETWVSTQYYMSKYHERKIDSTGHISYYDYIYGDNGVVALHKHSCIYTPDTINPPPNDTIGYSNDSIVWQRGAEGTDSLYYIHTDHLGSYCAITSPSKKLAQRNYFDPWGNMPKLFFGTYHRGDTIIVDEPYSGGDTISISEMPNINFSLTARGFTGHEHYPYFKIINMNGRLYDPVIARFFSPDKYVANSSFTQDFNRYTYARNNPLMYTDPDGEFPWLASIIAGFVMNGLSYTASVAASDGGFKNWDWGKFAFAALSGAATGAIGAGVNAVLSSAGVGGFFGGAISGSVTGAANGLMNGINMKWTTGNSKDFRRSFWIGVGTGAMFGGFMSGFDAVLDGRTFWNGNIRKEVTFAQSMNGAGQQGRGECLLRTMKSTSDLFGEDYTFDELSNNMVWAKDCSMGADAELSWENYANLTGKDYYSIEYPSETNFCRAFQDDYRVAVNKYQWDDDMQMIAGHSVRPHIVNATQLTRVNGTVVYRNVSGYLYNPSIGGQAPFRWTDIRSSRMFFLGN